VDEEKKERIAAFIIIGLLILSISTIYYDSVIEPLFDEIKEIQIFEDEGETWTMEIYESYDNSEALEFLKYSPPMMITINNKSMEVDFIVVVVMPEGMENRASFATHTYTKTCEDDDVIKENKSEMAYFFVDANVSKSIHDCHVLFNNPSNNILKIKYTY